MQIANAGKSVGLVGLLLTSLMIGLVTVPTASAVNETSSGTILTTETWSGTHTLTGDVTVAEGAKLVINAGTTINIPADGCTCVDHQLRTFGHCHVTC